MPELPQEIIKDPMILEFMGLGRKPSYYEKNLEQALIAHLHKFLLELGNGFTFVARQKRILIEVNEYFADLVSYSHLYLPIQEQLKQEIDERLSNWHKKS